MISFIFFFFFNELDICKYLGNFILSLSRNSWYIVKQVGNVLYNCFFVRNSFVKVYFMHV